MPISILMAERSLYLPLVGLAIAGGILFAEIPSVSARRIVGVGWLVIAIVLCIDHTYIWRNDFTFFQNMVRVQPESAKARLGYGFTLLGAGMKDDAAAQLQEGLRILPEYPALLSTLALTKMTQKTCDDAWPLLKRALEVDPKHGDSLRRVADCLYREGEIEKAEATYRKALEFIPYPDSLLLFMWGKSLEETGRPEPAIAAYERAALIDPKNVLIKQKLASLRAGATGTP
jgi:tetratricopeptide (TPR) repeat protein